MLSAGSGDAQPVCGTFMFESTRAYPREFVCHDAGGRKWFETGENGLHDFWRRASGVSGAAVRVTQGGLQFLKRLALHVGGGVAVLEPLRGLHAVPFQPCLKLGSLAVVFCPFGDETRI
jgi:hypothetical protein